MRESRTYGSVRGALSNERPYRDTNASSSRSLAVRRWRGRSLSTTTQRTLGHLNNGTAAHSRREHRSSPGGKHVGTPGG